VKLALTQATSPEDLDRFVPLGLGYLISYLKREAPWVTIRYFTEIDPLVCWRPDVVGISSVTQNFDVARKIAREVKANSKSLVVVGGVHISCLPESLFPEADFGVLSEGERTFAELMQALSNEETSFAEIPGICFHENEQVRITSPRPRIDILDELPLPDRSAIQLNGQEAHLVTSRGCAYDCSFCSAKTMWGPFRSHGVARVIEEIETLVKAGVHRIHLYDDLFVAGRKRVNEFAEEMARVELPEKVNLSMAVRANLVDDELCALLKQCGVDEVNFGAESPVDDVLCQVKSEVRAEDNERALKLLAEHEIRTNISLIVGMPEQDAEAMRETYRFLARHLEAGRIWGADVNVLAPFPGTIYYDQIVKSDKSFDWGDFARPWRRLLLNDQFERIAGELVAYDQIVRDLVATLRGPMLSLNLEPADEEKLRELCRRIPLRAAYGISPDRENQVFQRGTVDLGNLSPENLSKVLGDLGNIPTMILRGNSVPRLFEVSRAIVRWDHLDRRPFEDETGLVIVSAKEVFDWIDSGNREVRSRITRFSGDTIDLLENAEPSPSPGENVVDLLDRHAKRIGSGWRQ
jgi:radical SAM superfamily enzyme YgiQ (UPF0313 family)